MITHCVGNKNMATMKNFQVMCDKFNAVSIWHVTITFTQILQASRI